MIDVSTSSIQVGPGILLTLNISTSSPSIGGYNPRCACPPLASYVHQTINTRGHHTQWILSYLSKLQISGKAVHFEPALQIQQQL
jgi:hypothetical protein